MAILVSRKGSWGIVLESSRVITTMTMIIAIIAMMMMTTTITIWTTGITMTVMTIMRRLFMRIVWVGGLTATTFLFPRFQSIA
jgi:hypothetical protein